MGHGLLHYTPPLLLHAARAQAVALPSYPPYASQPVRDEVRVTKAAAAGHFLESLSQLQRGPGAELNAYLVRYLVITPIHPPTARVQS